jgi:hypothetical protein
VSVALRAIADDGHGLAVKVVQVSIVVVEHARQRTRQALAAATSA